MMKVSQPLLFLNLYLKEHYTRLISLLELSQCALRVESDLFSAFKVCKSTHSQLDFRYLT